MKDGELYTKSAAFAWVGGRIYMHPGCHSVQNISNAQCSPKDEKSEPHHH